MNAVADSFGPNADIRLIGAKMTADGAYPTIDTLSPMGTIGRARGSEGTAEAADLII